MNTAVWQITIAIVNMIAIPLMAFLIRMAQGQTKNENEEVISAFVQSLFNRSRNQETT
jgi:hypothetical protein